MAELAELEELELEDETIESFQPTRAATVPNTVFSLPAVPTGPVKVRIRIYSLKFIPINVHLSVDHCRYC